MMRLLARRADCTRVALNAPYVAAICGCVSHHEDSWPSNLLRCVAYGTLASCLAFGCGIANAEPASDMDRQPPAADALAAKTSSLLTWLGARGADVRQLDIRPAQVSTPAVDPL